MDGEVTLPELTEVVARVAALLGPREGTVVQLEGGITNRNFRVNFGGHDYVVRLAGKRTELLGIDREAECTANKAAAELGFAPAVATLLHDPPCLVTVFVPGRAMKPEELRTPEAIAEVASDLRALHDSGTSLTKRFDPFRLVDEYATTAREHGATIPDGYEAARPAAQAVEQAVRPGARDGLVACHNDLLTANFLRGSSNMQLIDWEYAGMGDRWFDLGNFAANAELDEGGSESLVAAYFRRLPDDHERARLHVYRFVSDLREAMWGTLQSVLSNVSFDFLGYARAHFERAERTGTDPRFQEWIAAAGSR